MGFLSILLFASFLLANYPVVLVPGLFGSQLNYKTSASSSWSAMWNFLNSILNPSGFVKNMQAQYDASTDTFSNKNVYATEVVGWGTTTGLDHLDDLMASTTYYFHSVITSLKNKGYKEGTDLFGAPFDFRLENYKSVNADGGLYSSLKTLIEKAQTGTGKPVFLVSASEGAQILRDFLAHYVDSDWKKNNIAGWISCGGGFGGAPILFHGLISYKTSFINTLNGNQMHDAAQYFAGEYWSLPTLQVYKPDQLLAQVTTSSSSFNITIENITEGFKRSSGDGAAAAAQKFLDVLNGEFDAPNVDLYYFYGTGIATVFSEVYSGKSDSNWWQTDGQATNVDGDGIVPTDSATAPEIWSTTSSNVIQGKAIVGVDAQEILSNEKFVNDVVSIVTAGGWETNPARPFFEVTDNAVRAILSHARSLENSAKDLISVTAERVAGKLKAGKLNRRGKKDELRGLITEGVKAVEAECRTFVALYTSAEESFYTAARAVAESRALTLAELTHTLRTRAVEVGVQLDTQHTAVVQAVKRVATAVETLLETE